MSPSDDNTRWIAEPITECEDDSRVGFTVETPFGEYAMMWCKRHDRPQICCDNDLYRVRLQIIEGVESRARKRAEVATTTLRQVSRRITKHMRLTGEIEAPHLEESLELIRAALARRKVA